MNKMEKDWNEIELEAERFRTGKGFVVMGKYIGPISLTEQKLSLGSFDNEWEAIEHAKQNTMNSCYYDIEVMTVNEAVIDYERRRYEKD